MKEIKEKKAKGESSTLRITPPLMRDLMRSTDLLDSGGDRGAPAGPQPRFCERRRRGINRPRVWTRMRPYIGELFLRLVQSRYSSPLSSKEFPPARARLLLADPTKAADGPLFTTRPKRGASRACASAKRAFVPGPRSDFLGDRTADKCLLAMVPRENGLARE
ncbi:hypothetical protein KM043_012828 [Ampulex compressa]|nr:hypothetical protein KM043_012828 [Ampulex compressa]